MQAKPFENSLFIHRPRKRRNLIGDPKHQQKSQNLKLLHQTLITQEPNKLNQAPPERNSIIQLQHNSIVQPQHNSIVQPQHNSIVQPQHNSIVQPQQSSIVQLQRNNLLASHQRSRERQQSYISQQPRRTNSQSRDKQQQKSFYINVQKLRNLKKQGREQRRTQSSHSLVNNYVRRDQLQKERRSQLLKSYAIKRDRYDSQQHQGRGQPIGRQSMEKQYNKEQIGNRDSLANNKEHPNKDYSSIKENSKEKAGRAKARYRMNTEEEEGRVSQSNKKSVFKRAHNQSILKDRTFIEGYLRGKQLGRGGFSKVWEGFNFKTKTFYAVKEIDTTNKYQTHLTQIWFGNFFFENGQPKKEFLSHEGIHSLLRMVTYSIMDPRAFIVYESCGGSVGNMLYDIYEQDRDDDINEDDKLYMIKYKLLYDQLRKDTCFLKTMIYQVAQALDLLAQHKIVHSDIKTENILLNVSEDAPHWQFRLIDYGSSFVFENLKQYKLATPEYMCPQLLNYILYENKKPHREQMLEYVRHYENTSAIDVWGVGCIVIQLVHGVPLWLSNRTKIMINGKHQTKRGLFAVSDRSFSKILERQLHLVDNLEAFLRKQNNSGIALDSGLKQLLKGMLCPNPKERLRPKQIIQALSKQP